MPLPLIAVASALAAGGTLVPHAAGGMIVTAAGGYVAGTYLSTAAVATIIATATATAGAGLAAVAGTASAIIGSAGIFGTTVGATGLTGVLMSAGVLPSTPIIVPVAVGAATLGGAGLAYYLLRLRRKVASAKEGQEAQFTEREAKVVQVLLLQLAKKPPSKST